MSNEQRQRHLVNIALEHDLSPEEATALAVTVDSAAESVGFTRSRFVRHASMNPELAAYLCDVARTAAAEAYA